MKKILLVVWTLVLSCSFCFGQTNNPSAVAARKLPNPVQRHTTQKQNTPTVATVQNTSTPLAHYEDVNSYTLSQTTQGARPSEDGIIARIGQEGLLAPSPAVSAALRPKIIRVGHAKVYSSVATAIARKNPLCLLDATFLNISF